MRAPTQAAERARPMSRPSWRSRQHGRGDGERPGDGAARRRTAQGRERAGGRPRHPCGAGQLVPGLDEREQGPAAQEHRAAEERRARRCPQTAKEQGRPRTREKEVQHGIAAVPVPRPQDEMEERRWIERLDVGVRPEGLAEREGPAPRGPAPMALHRLDEGFHLRVPHEVHVAAEEHPALEKSRQHRGRGQEQEDEEMSALLHRGRRKAARAASRPVADSARPRGRPGAW